MTQDTSDVLVEPPPGTFPLDDARSILADPSHWDSSLEVGLIHDGIVEGSMRQAAGVVDARSAATHRSV